MPRGRILSRHKDNACMYLIRICNVSRTPRPATLLFTIEYRAHFLLQSHVIVGVECTVIRPS